MTIPPLKEAAGELYPNVADVAAKYGDPNGTYAAFLFQKQPTYAQNPYFLWDQPFSDSGLMVSRNISGTVTGPAVPTDTSSSGAGWLGLEVARVVATEIAVVLVLSAWMERVML
jgi:hypothetical protein